MYLDEAMTNGLAALRRRAVHGIHLRLSITYQTAMLQGGGLTAEYPVDGVGRIEADGLRIHH
jgi:hypothetical protein